MKLQGPPTAHLTPIGFWLRSRARGLETMDYYEQLIYPPEKARVITEYEHQMETGLTITQLMYGLEGIVGAEET